MLYYTFMSYMYKGENYNMYVITNQLNIKYNVKRKELGKSAIQLKTNQQKCCTQ